MNLIARLIARRARRIVRERGPDFIVGGAHDPYLERWFAIPRTRLMNIYIHRFKRDDDDRALHDHPWPSVSVMLSGELLEHYKSGEYTRRRSVHPGDIVLRAARFAHRLEVVDGPALTLFITGPRIRRWGFHCPNGWRHWKLFVSPKDKGSIGRGCE